MNHHKPEVIVVTGPTATGKTVIGANVAKELNSEVISVDSQLVYKDLCIGVARPTDEEMLGVKHHMIGVASPMEDFSAGHYAQQAGCIMNSLIERGKTPVLVGGTGFYLRALLQPDYLPNVPTDQNLRMQLKEEVKTYGLSLVYERLKQIDSERALMINPNDEVRVLRALEIIELTGKKVPNISIKPAFSILAAGLTFADRTLHVDIIKKRLDRMMHDGFMEEVKMLYEKYGLCAAIKKAHGYPELVEVIQGKRSIESAIEQININIRQYSKRQMTWFRKFPGIKWYNVDEQTEEEIILDIISKVI